MSAMIASNSLVPAIEGYGKHRELARTCLACLTAWPCQKVVARRRRDAALAALPSPPMLPDGTPDLTWYDWIVLETSGGKDSLAMKDYVWNFARIQGVLDRIVAVHADLGEVEWDATVDLGPDWKGTADLTRRQCERYGMRLIVVQRTIVTGVDEETGEEIREVDGLLEQVLRRGAWPSSGCRYCTSDQKRAPARALMTKLAAELGPLGRPARILNCMGMRGQESCRREEMPPFSLDTGATYPKTRGVWQWLPIHGWTVEQVWERNRASGAPIHPIYAKGMSRASCSFCILASKPDLLLAIKLRPGLAAKYVAVEQEIGHTFRHNQSMESLVDEAAALGGRPTRPALPAGPVQLELTLD